MFGHEGAAHALGKHSIFWNRTMSAYGEFLAGLLRDPRRVSAPTPSGPTLAAAIAAKVNLQRPGLVVELGPGTGVVTAALLARGIAPERILAIEHSRFFTDLLASRFLGVAVVRGDAFSFESYIPAGMPIAAVVSGVPLLNFSIGERQQLIGRALAHQGLGGRFIQLSYGWKPPIAASASATLSRTFVWKNLPPAHIWTYEACAVKAPKLRLVSTTRPANAIANG
jgi:phosphatidylethanolamine/phosphatidyl-N-methylethanolamine N-methyltransferase